MRKKTKKEQAELDALDSETLMTEFDYEEEMARVHKMTVVQKLVKKAKKLGGALVKKIKKAHKKE